MTVQVHPTAYGEPALATLRAVVRDAKRHDPLAPVTLVVPTNTVGVAARRSLAAEGVAGLTVLTVFRLAELLGGPRLAEAGRVPVSRPAVAAVATSLLAAEPGVFAPVAGHPATAKALVEAHRTLATLRALPDGGRAARRAVAASSPRAASVVALHEALVRELAPWSHDEADLLVAARAAVGSAPAQAAAALGTVVVHLPQELAPGAVGLLAEVAAATAVHVVLGRTGHADADADAHALCRALGAPEPPQPAEVVRPAGPLRITSASDADEEVRAAVRHVAGAVAAGSALGSIAVLYPSSRPYARLVVDRLEAAGYRCHHVGARPAAERVVGRTLLAALALPEAGFPVGAVFTVLAGAPVTGGTRGVPVARWQRHAREAGVVRGLDEWRERLAGLAAAHRARADVLDDGDWLRSRADDVDALAAFVDELARRAHVERATWRATADRTTALVHWLLGDEERWARQGWPEAEIRAGRAVLQAVDRLGALDGVTDPPDDLGWRRALGDELEAATGRQGRFGDGVLVGPLSAAVGVPLDVVVVVGLAEGVAPALPTDDPLLPDRERAAAHGLLPLRAHAPHRQERHFLAALAAAPDRLLLWPRGDLRGGGERMPSRWLVHDLARSTGVAHLTARQVAALPRGLEQPDGTTLAPPRDCTEIASFAASLRTLVPATPTEHRLATVWRTADPAAATAALAGSHPTLAQGLAVLSARRSPAFTPYDGDCSDVAHLLAPRLQGLVSATQLERYAGCPFAYLVQHVLGVRPLEEPEEVVDADARTIGLLVHDTLDRFLRPSCGGDPATGFGSDGLAALRQAFLESAAQLVGQGRTGHPVLWEATLTTWRRNLERWFHEEAHARVTHGRTTVACELRFASQPHAPIAWPLPGGGHLHLHGSIDRVDRDADGTVVVVDYKSGRSDDFHALEADPCGAGQRLQLPLYALAALHHVGAPLDAPARATYRFLSHRAKRANVDVPIDDHTRDVVGAALGTIVDGITAGWFPARPSATPPPWVTCPACDPDALGTRALRAGWERKAVDPRLRPYAALVRDEPAPPAPGDHP